MNNETGHNYSDFLDGRSSASMGDEIEKLEALGVDVSELLIKKYRFSRRWADRKACVYHSTRYARSHKEVFQLGILALQDKSKVVRHQACKLLAATRNRDAVKHLQQLLTDEGSDQEAKAAIEQLLND